MALENMYEEMFKQLQKSYASNETLDSYATAWASAIKNTGLPIPCPNCFVGGKISRLSPLNDKDGISSARCLDCKEKFEWVSPE